MNRMIFNLASTGLLTQHGNYCATKCLLHSQMDHKPVNGVSQRRSVDMMGKFRSYAVFLLPKNGLNYLQLNVHHVAS